LTASSDPHELLLITDADGAMAIECSRYVLAVFSDALNEELNGLGVVPGSLDRIGATEDELERLLERFHSAYTASSQQSPKRSWITSFIPGRKVPTNDGARVAVPVSVKELRTLLWVVDDVMTRLEELEELDTRMGITMEELTDIQNGLRALVTDRAAG
jgi:hypothetical protein